MRFKLMNPFTEEHTLQRKMEAWESLTQLDCIQIVALCAVICAIGFGLLWWDATRMLGICIMLMTGPISIFFLIWWLAVVRRNPPPVVKVPDGRCDSCGYNLTGNTSGTCPECGTAVPQAPRPG